MRKFGAAGAALALIIAAMPAAPVFAGPSEDWTPGHQQADTPRRLLNMLFLDLAGLAGPQMRSPPLWRSYLSGRTAELQRQLDAADADDRWDAVRLDWLCQCQNRRQAKIPPIVLQEKRTQFGRALTIQIAMYAADRQALTIEFVDEDGWKIDDIIDEHGQRFTAALAKGRRDHQRRHQPLP